MKPVEKSVENSTLFEGFPNRYFYPVVLSQLVLPALLHDHLG